ncbi:Signal transduction histidine kinase regulating C4-dicarboxylate transport system [Paramagnetospirillum caucaseum]|uniref:histidine kinase n=1 Tax=Paramagnetospirillum caucaseum TaxID=1244869 RepID=M3AC00_9PROT|nr:HAMP domain-containing sensor histidine kinase [Paramagnetospirillum caucaseum]EME70318.1 Signal transduction histidine kinase regulating C4-dicarboxylate transport system [Paramagnetospirillum caucaseum]
MPRPALRLRSFAVKLASVALIFAVVPVLLYLQLETVENQRNALMLRLAQEQGKLVGEALFPLLEQFSPRNADRIDPAVKRLAEGGMSVKVLFRPAPATGARTFLLVASAPETGPQQARAAMDRLVDSGVLAHLAASCEGRAPLAVRLAGAQEGAELLTYLAPHATRLGCWVVLTAQPTGTLPEQVIGRPYWQSPDVQVAASIYLLMAVLVLSILTDAWGNLRRFQAVARSVIRGESKVSFATGNRVPELAETAAELDSMVATLKRSERLLRQAAEENAHALKAPLAVISQSLEPLGRAVPAGNARALRALELIGRSVERLDGLVSTIRRTDETIAALIDLPRRRVEASTLLNRLGRGYIRMAAERSIGLDIAVAAGLQVSGRDEMLEVIAENLLDNALDFSPPGGQVAMRLREEEGMALLRVQDNGPGVAEDELERIFERHVSRRSAGQGGDVEHYGLGLWIVRRNAEAMGGRAWAVNAPEGGLEVSVALPLSD